MHVELWSNTGGKARVIAIIRASGGEVLVEEHEPVPPRVRAGIEDARRLSKGDDAFLRILPVEFSGTFYRATLIK